MRDFVENHVAHQDVKLLVRLLGYFKPYTGKFIGAFLLMIVTTFTNMVMPLASGLAIDLMVDPAYSLEQKVTVVFIGAAILLIITGLSILIGYFQSIMLQRIGQKITDQLRAEVFNHIESLSIGQINQLPVGKLVTRATNDPGNISEMFTNTIVNLIRNFLFMLVIAIIMMIPLTPGGSGVAELGATSFYSLFVPSSIVGVFVLLWRLILYYLNILLGLLSSLVIVRREFLARAEKQQ